MPGFASKAQMEKLAGMVKDGKFKQADYDRLLSETNVEALPERLHAKKDVVEPKGGMKE